MLVLFPDGSRKEFACGTTTADIAASLGQKIKKQAVAALVNGSVKGLSEPLNEDCELKILTFEDDEGKRVLRHSASHVLAQAVKRVRPDAKLAIGPAIDNGFYYDFDLDPAFSQDDLQAIENQMAKIIKQNDRIERFELEREAALEFMREEPYKCELINDLPEGEKISFYKQGDFTDLCAGPHLPSTGMVKFVKITSTAGAYWRGDEHNKMLKRIYATAFPTKEALDEYIARIEEAKKRDHRKIGRELSLFTLFDEGPGFPFFLPKGMILKNTLIDYWREVHKKYGYVEISTPMILNRALWERSGHWEHYQGNMYTTSIDDTDFAIKPMNCPGGMLVYGFEPKSYRDLPLRCGELGLVHRNELSGTLHGLMRVRCFTQDDAHIFMTRDQMKSEIQNVVKLLDEVYTLFGLSYEIELSTMPDDHIGTIEEWEVNQNILKDAITEMGKTCTVNEGDGAFYGPKLDFHLKDCLERTWQCGTIQLDSQLPERFELTYTGADGEKHRPVMLHRVVFGSIERFIGIITEHFAGAFPLWLSPVQVRVMTITNRADEAAKRIMDILKENNIRAELDDRNEKIGFKIREAQNLKIPYMLVIGDKEAAEGNVSVRARGKGDIGTMKADEFVNIAKKLIKDKAIEL
ncbi:MAG: threonine--tRNA ligase [Clostridiales bacterium]|nr:threonine--tRNA ligase [Clostridiales bacterium]